MLPAIMESISNSALKKVALPLIKDVVLHNATKQIARPLAIRCIAILSSALNIQDPKLLGINAHKYHVEFKDGLTNEKKNLFIPKVFVSYPGNPLYMDNSTLTNVISKYLTVQDKCNIPRILDEFLSLDKENIHEYDFSKLNSIYNSPNTYPHKFYRGVRDLETGKSMALNSFLASKIAGTTDCPAGNGILPGFITPSFDEAKEYSNKNSVILEFIAKSDKNQKTGPYGGSEYTTFEDIEKDGVVLIGIHKGRGEFNNKSAFSTNYD